VVPKIFYTSSSYEYYGRAMSLIHTTVDGTRDFAPDAGTRIYMITGTQHGAGRFPPPKSGTQNLASANDYRWAMRALLPAMQQWVSTGVEPPASRYPTISSGELVPLTKLKFPKITGIAVPTPIHSGLRLDYGPEFLSKGIISLEPPRVGKEFPALVPQVDPADGNEIAGIRLPMVQAPLATHAGWNLRAPEVGAPDELFSMIGSYIPFARTRAERMKSGDPRASIEERYKNRQDYISKISAASDALVKERYLLKDDVKAVIEQATAQWDYYVKEAD
ncbi:MAG: alpha/beta hydrolase domain-containing protein, partial [Candidatus Korobacteraceae bacterium]